MTARTMAELIERRDRVTGADMVELRLDGIDRPSPAGALTGRRLPAIVTCRPVWEGGRFDGAEAEREAILAEALTLGAEYVDVEWRAGYSNLLAQTNGRRLVVSLHDFTGMPANLEHVVAQMRATGAEVVKVAVTPSRLSDVLALARLADGCPAPSMVLIGMGETGLPSRILASRFGSCWTYVGDGVAPGQVPATRLCEEFGFRRIGPDTALYGVLGRPVSHSLSPAMHNAAFRAAGMDAVYVPVPAADFADFLEFAAAMALAGASVTAPYKVDAFNRVDECDSVSRRVRSVNTLRHRNGRWEGRNTDVEGFLAPLSAVSLAGARATVLGAGGAARAVAVALDSAGARVTIAARRAQAAREVAELAGASTCGWPPPGDWEILVNTTTVGTSPDVDATPLPGGPFPGRVVYDLVYNPLETRLLRDAAAAGCHVIGGLEMLVAQAQRQFEWWTGHSASARVMRDAALARLAAGTTQPSGHPASLSESDVP